METQTTKYVKTMSNWSLMKKIMTKHTSKLLFLINYSNIKTYLTYVLCYVMLEHTVQP